MNLCRFYSISLSQSMPSTFPIHRWVSNGHLKSQPRRYEKEWHTFSLSIHLVRQANYHRRYHAAIFPDFWCFLSLTFTASAKTMCPLNDWLRLPKAKHAEWYISSRWVLMLDHTLHAIKGGSVSLDVSRNTISNLLPRQIFRHRWSSSNLQSKSKN
jgi:hypothetical protein